MAPTVPLVLRRPGHAARVGRALARGFLFRAWCWVRGFRFTAGRNFRLAGRLSLRGPGRVVFGDNVRVADVVTAWTYDIDAVITVGHDVFLNGPHFWCRRAITVGDRSILAEARLMDTEFHSVQVNRHNPAAPVRVQPITVSDNVWLCAQAALLPGTVIGQNSVVGFGAVCTGEYPADVVIAGNPARVVRSIADESPLTLIDERRTGGE